MLMAARVVQVISTTSATMEIVRCWPLQKLCGAVWMVCSIFSSCIPSLTWSAGLIGHLKHFPVMYRLYEVLHQHPELLTSEEEDIASSKRVLEKDASREYLSQLEKVSENIVKALEKQAAKTVVCLFLSAHCNIYWCLFVEQLGSSKIWASAAWMDHHLWSAIWGSRATWVPWAFRVYSSYWQASTYSWSHDGPAKGQGDGCQVWGRSAKHVCHRPSLLNIDS